MRDKVAVVSTVLGAVLTFWAAVLMRDHIRMVEIVTLFFGGYHLPLLGIMKQHCTKIGRSRCPDSGADLQLKFRHCHPSPISNAAISEIG